jgi:hypothetical protein
MGFSYSRRKANRSRTRRFKDCVKYKEKINKMEYEQKEIKPLLEDGSLYFNIKITSENGKETKWLRIPKNLLIGFYNSFN